MARTLEPTAPTLPLARFSVEQYHRMIESGALDEEDGVELIDGWVVQKMAKGPAHEYATGRIEDFLRDRLPAGWHVRNQAPITLAQSEPEPDLSVARGARDAYRSRHPQAEDVVLVVEVADTSLAVDRVKGAAYGKAGVPVYWLVNLSERCIEVYTQPSAREESGYAARQVLRADDELELLVEGRRHGAIEATQLLS